MPNNRCIIILLLSIFCLQSCSKDDEVPNTANESILFIDSAPEESIEQEISLTNGDYVYVGDNLLKAFIKRTNNRGALLWSHTHMEASHYADVAEDSEGNIIAVGFNRESNAKGLIDGFITKFDKDGKILWQNTCQIDSTSSLTFDYVSINSKNDDIVIPTHHLGTNRFSTYYITVYTTEGDLIKVKNVNIENSDLDRLANGVIRDNKYKFLARNGQMPLLVNLDLDTWDVRYELLGYLSSKNGIFDFTIEKDFLLWIENEYIGNENYLRLVRYNELSNQLDSFYVSDSSRYLRFVSELGQLFIIGDSGSKGFVAQLSDDYSKMDWKKTYDIGNEACVFSHLVSQDEKMQVIGSFYRQDDATTANFLLNLNIDGTYAIP